MGPLAGVAVGWLLASSLAGGFGSEGWGLRLLQQAVLGVVVFAFVMLLRRRRAARAGVEPRAVVVPSPVPASSARSNLDEGIRDIRRMDLKFDPTRFTGYIEMVFRSVHRARMSREAVSLRDRVTPELYRELQAQFDQLRDLGHTSHVDGIEIRAEVTEAWHEEGRDYVTAYIVGAMVDYTVDETTSAVVAGSKSAPQGVEAFWTFTRQAGLNPWMLSAIQTS
jgi:predicted lipid-binding transport protein (Tim44 family)